ncbi:FecR family protein [Flavihumibacter solisilvae]|uniref:Iron dicitrate transport regulator FecR n=1 Tax=Flavihumibacter solisilvae TaxID=1349421 RepID=A0A0C1J0C8_9BACT|nr:FecR family protein [Flavihumibacter solisilvae]KIC96219.1 hypothetical protein OI18_00125 [Flavihumibacter solisilvae]
MNNKQLNELLQGYLDNTLDARETEQLEEYLRREESQATLQKAIDRALEENAYAGLSDKSRADILFQGILQKAGERERFRFRPTWWMAAASVIIVLAGTASYLFFKRQSGNEIVQTKQIDRFLNNDTLPDGNRATLTLGDGSSIVLDEINDTLILQGDTKVVKQNNNHLAYAPENKTGKVVYNTVSTPRGGQYQVILPDGTKVWLNAASSLRFPTVFSGSERRVEMTGEVYFEVAKNTQQPFRVTASGIEVKVLGTHFNVNAYADEESINTTLLEGSVIVSKNNEQATIKPGQQARVKDGIDITDDVDAETLMAWKNGRFSFNNARLESLMRQIARWYDVDVVIDGKITDTYTIDIPRNVSLSKLLRFIELSGGVHFIVEGKKITCNKVRE